jgi:hypothetical protein
MDLELRWRSLYPGEPRTRVIFRVVMCDVYVEAHMQDQRSSLVDCIPCQA